MKKILSYSILVIYILGFVACSGKNTNTADKSTNQEQKVHDHGDHDHEGEEHDHDEHDHDHGEENQEHNHDEHDHPHEGNDEHDHEEHKHEEGTEHDDHNHDQEDGEHDHQEHVETDDDHSGHDHAAEDVHNHGNELPTIKFSQIVDGVEIFAEYPALVKGEPAKFITHFTNLINYKPISDAKASLYYGDKKIAQANKVLRNGIFILNFTPNQSGKKPLSVELNYAGKSYSFKFRESRIFNSKDEAIHANIPHIEPDIVFLKEQAWVGNFAINKVQKKAFNSVVHTSGEIIPSVDNRITIVAQSSGILVLPNKMVAGKKLTKGELLVSIKSDKLENSREVAYQVAKAEFNDLESRYQIAAKLVKDGAISKKEFSQLEAQYSGAKAKLDVFGSFNKKGEFVRDNSTSGSGAMNIVSPRSAYLAKVNVRNGDFVEQGSVIATLVVGDSYLLKVDFPKHELSKMANVIDANFVPEYMNKSDLADGALSVSELGGYPLYNSKTTAGRSPYIPFYFNLPDDERLVPNSFVTVSVESKTEELNEVISVPISAVLENESNYWVYVEIEGENYTKHEVSVGENNGKEIVITDGLNVGEIVVTRGAFRVKQASSSSDIPEHAH